MQPFSFQRFVRRLFSSQQLQYASSPSQHSSNSSNDIEFEIDLNDPNNIFSGSFFNPKSYTKKEKFQSHNLESIFLNDNFSEDVKLASDKEIFNTLNRIEKIAKSPRATTKFTNTPSSSSLSSSQWIEDQDDHGE